MNKGLIIFSIILVLGTSALAAEECLTTTLQVHLFYSETCPHCAKEKPIMEKIDRECKSVDVSFHPVNVEKPLWEQFAANYNTTTRGVPMTFIDDKVFIGFSEDDGTLDIDPISGAYIGYENQILSAIQEHVPEKCNIEAIVHENDARSFNPWLIFLFPLAYLLTYFIFKNKSRKLWLAGLFGVIIICIFIFAGSMPDTSIKAFAENLPFPVFVFIIALADGFNPCAFTVLIILLSILTYTKRRSSMSLIGSTFIITSALMYFIFIMTMILIGSWALEQYGTLILFVLGVIVTVAAIINLKDFFFLGKGVSLSISGEQKSKILHKAGRIGQKLKSAKDNKWMILTALASTVLLAAFVNLVELGCTAILPTVYMASLIARFGSGIGLPHLFWTGIYAIVYILPLLAILFNFVYTLKSARLTEKQGRILKLVAGLFMLLFGMIMIFSPELLLFG